MNKPSDPGLYYSGTRAELRPYIPSHHKVLEVGCGSGGFRANLSPDAEVWGIEMHPQFAEEAKAKLNKVLVGSYDDVEQQLPNQFFDLVVCNDVIEHMADDRAFLQKLHRVLAPGATLMGSVPNMRHWPVLKSLVLSKDWEYQNEGILDRTHLRFYTVKSFPKLLQQTGYQVKVFQGINRNMKLWTRRFLTLLLPRWSSDVFYVQFVFVAHADSVVASADSQTRPV